MMIIYTKGKEEGTLNADWCHPDVGVGKSVATGGSIEGFEGTYTITYLNDDGSVNAIRELIIKRKEDYFEIFWQNEDITTSEGIGMENDGNLIAGWKNV